MNSQQSNLFTKDLENRLFYTENVKDLGNKCVLSIRIRCQDDLILEMDLKVRVIVVLDSTKIKWEKIQIFLDQQDDKKYFESKYLLEQETQDSIEIKLLWLESNVYNYPLAVHLYCIRNLLKKTDLPPWQCSVLLHKEFRENRDGNVAMSSSSIPTKLIFGVSKSKGRRNYMEDVEFIYENVKISEKDYISLFGVLDGHGGVDCAQYISDEIPMKVTSLLRRGQAPQSTLFQTFQEIDMDFLRTCAGSNAGSTACVLLFNRSQNVIYIANTGDTRAVLSHNNIAIDLSFDRKATDSEEIARIACNGGFVNNGRVMGILAVARAFGDYQIKKMRPSTNNMGTDFNRFLVVDPEISTFFPVQNDEFIIVATDGLWDVMSSQGAVDFIRLELQKENISLPADEITGEELKPILNKIGNKLISHAIEKGSTDNITVLIAVIFSQETERKSSSSISVHGVSNYQTTAKNTSTSQKSNLDNDFETFLGSLTKSNDFGLNYIKGAPEVPKKQQTTVNSAKLPPKISKGGDDDDFLEFLKDDSNFLA